MYKPLAVLAAALIILILAVGTAAGAVERNEFTIPLHRYVNLSTNLTIHTIQVTISDVTYGGAYSEDPINTTWPVLVFQYENYGVQQVAGRLHVQFVDNASTIYDKKDVYTGGPIYPGKQSPPQTLEIALPKGRTLTGLIVIDEWTGKQVLIPIEYPAEYAPSAIPTPAPVIVVVVDDNLRNLLIIPLILVIVGLVGFFIAKGRLF